MGGGSLVEEKEGSLMFVVVVEVLVVGSVVEVWNLLRVLRRLVSNLEWFLGSLKGVRG